MGGSFKIGRVAGIGIYIHFTFLVLVAVVVIADWSTGPLRSVIFLLALFGCVLLHELGHAMTAKVFGVRTRDITLLPIGGVARLEKIPEKPFQELLITINGPLVNLVIAAVIALILAAAGRLPGLTASMDQAKVVVSAGDLLVQLMHVNIWLVLFNLVPAFPMDGGRILRAVLAFFLDYPTATRIAARVGQGIAIVFAIVGIVYNPFLLIIAAFVFMGAQAEAESSQMRSAFAGLRVADGMMTNFRALSETDTLATATEALLAGSQQDFPVVATAGPSAGQVVGMLARTELFRAIAERGPSGLVADAMQRECPIADPRAPVDKAFQQMRDSGCSAIPVVDGGRLVGLLTIENLTELIAVREAAARARGGARRG